MKLRSSAIFSSKIGFSMITGWHISKIYPICILINKTQVASVVEFRPGSESFVKELTAVRDQLVKVILVYAR